jgi:hypothetical protein
MAMGKWFTTLAMIAVLVGSGAAAAWAAGQEDEPPPTPPAKHKEEGVDIGIYLDAGKALKFHDFSRLNHALAPGGVSPFTGAIDDWSFELAVVSTNHGYLALGGGFWKASAGGSPVSADLSGYDVLARFGTTVLGTKFIQLYPSFGLGYATHALDLDGELKRLDFSRIGGSRSAEIRQSAMLVEAGVRVDVLGAWPNDTRGAFLTAQSLTLGWQGQPIASDWNTGGGRVHGPPNDFTHALVVRLNLGFGGGVRDVVEKK